MLPRPLHGAGLGIVLLSAPALADDVAAGRAKARALCQNCHGEVQRFERVSQQASLTMGWCLDCHEQRGAPRQCDTCHK